jgi:hypothetical protein
MESVFIIESDGGLPPQKRGADTSGKAPVETVPDLLKSRNRVTEIE